MNNNNKSNVLNFKAKKETRDIYQEIADDCGKEEIKQMLCVLYILQETLRMKLVLAENENENLRNELMQLKIQTRASSAAQKFLEFCNR